MFALLPRHLENDLSDRLSEVDCVTPVWYDEDGLSSLTPISARKRVWLVNGMQLPLIDWRAAGMALRRQGADVIVFGPNGTTGADRYQESISVGETGEVLRFHRHYCDSPAFADPWAGEAEFLAVSVKNTPTVINHVIARGWGLDSIGVLTRRFSVRWASNPCILAELDLSTSAVSENPGYNGGGNGDIHHLAAVRAYVGDELSVQSETTTDDGTHSEQDGFQLEPTHTRHTGKPDERTPGAVSATRKVTPAWAYPFFKRTMDIIASAAGLALLSPLLVTVAVLVKWTSRGPVLFGHKRQGLGGKEFSCLKFRSMCNGADALQAKLREQNEVDGPQFKIDNDPRLTKVGAWLRRTNMDELPQLINVLLGQMSLVGPRPSPDNENQLCPAWRRTRLSVRPGITGLWQVLRLRDDDRQSDFQEWIYYDVEYARHRSLWLDMQLLAYTPISILAPKRLTVLARRLRRRGICAHSARLRTVS